MNGLVSWQNREHVTENADKSIQFVQLHCDTFTSSFHINLGKFKSIMIKLLTGL